MCTIIASIALLLILATPCEGIVEARKSRWNSECKVSGHPSVQHRTQEHLCGGGYCKCYNISADCSGHNGSLLYVPNLPKNVKCLNFSNNRVKTIDTDDFFANVSGVTHIDFSRNGLYSISQGAFKRFTKITFLNINYNNLTFSELDPVLSVPTLVVLLIDGMGLKNMPVGIFSKYRLPKLTELGLAGNHLWTVNLTEFAPLTSLTLLGLNSNQIGHGLAPGSLPGLQTLYLNKNCIFEFPETCQGNSSFYPKLQKLYLSGNSLDSIPGKVCLQSLELLELTNNVFTDLLTDMFNFQKFPSLTHLYMRHMSTRIYCIQPYAFRHHGLLKLDLTEDSLDIFDKSVISGSSFQGLPSLRLLHLSRNYYENVDDFRFIQLFGNLPCLKYFSFDDVRFSRLTTKTFISLTSLENLMLKENEITYIPEGTFDMLVNLFVLGLNGNQISGVRESTFSWTLFHHLRNLDLSGNPLQCNCDLRWFRGQLKDRPSLFRSNWSNYMCANHPNTSVQSFFVSDQSCLFNPETNGRIVFMTSSVIFVLTVFCTFYRYRWHIRLLLYGAFRGNGRRLQRLQEHQFEYDVFVSYASEDLPWVRAHLLPELEGRLGLRLCIHQREFIPGENIVDNIVNFVRTSKKVMMLFSMDFVRSQWCQFELNYCLRHVLEHDDMLLIISLRPIPTRHLTPAMMAVMKVTTYIQWADEPDAVESFWRRIHIALNEVMS